MQPVAGSRGVVERHSPFRRLSMVHAAMIGGDAAMVVALADSVFFSVEPDAARERVLLFLVLSFAPFLLIAPLIGPLLDRIAGGRRAVIQFVAVSRVVLSILMAFSVDSLMLFPLVFASLVLQRTYLVSKSAIVPSVVRTERDLVEANSKLGVIAGVTGTAAVLPAAAIQALVGGAGTLVYAALIFTFTLVASSWLSADVIAGTAPGRTEQLQLHSAAVRLGALVMVLLRATVGFVFFLIAMVLKDDEAALAVYGTALGAGAVGTFLGNVAAVRARGRVSERLMLLASLGLSGAAGLSAALFGGTTPLVGLTFATGFAAAFGRLGFESILQKDAPAANRGRAFANFETRFQFGWAAAGLIPVVVTMSGQLGALIVGIVCAGGILYTVLLPRVAPGVTVGSISERAVAKIRTRKDDAAR